MSKLTLVRGQLIYTSSTSHVSVYEGLLQPQNLPVAIKEKTHSSLQSANQTIQEAMCMCSLSHPSIVQIYDCYLDQRDVWVSVIAVELMKGDLGKEMERRKSEQTPWRDEELVEILRKLASALSYAEKRGISHRDIKPENLFITGNQIKIGDFGASTRNLSISALRQTLQGSPFFLSPELKKGYANMLVSGDAEVNYDPIKSDVYSLGVTIMSMAYLEPPEQLVNLAELRKVTEKLVLGLPQYPHVQPYLSWMLEIEPENRPSFQEIDDYFLQFGEYYDNLQNKGGSDIGPETVTILPSKDIESTTFLDSLTPISFHKEPEPTDTKEELKICTPEEPLSEDTELPSVPGFSRLPPKTLKWTNPAPKVDVRIPQEAVRSPFIKSAPCIKPSPTRDVPQSRAQEYGYPKEIPVSRREGSTITANPMELGNTCAECGLVYLPIDPVENALFCSNICKEASQFRASAKCAICNKPIGGGFHLPEEHFDCVELYESCCSLKCLLEFRKFLKDETCAYCSVVLNPQSSLTVRLPCSHQFHDKDCFFDFMTEASDYFATTQTVYYCPKCGLELNYKKDIKSVFAGESLGKRINEAKERRCPCCKDIAFTTKHRCGHKYCGLCESRDLHRCQNGRRKHK